MISEKKKMNYQGVVVNTESSSIIKNAPLTNNTPIIVQEFRTKPVSTTCRFCLSPIITKTEFKFNCLACFFFY